MLLSEIESIKYRIISALDSEAEQFRDMKRPDLTRSILTAIGKVAGPYQVFPGKFGLADENKNEKGFLFDLCWIQYKPLVKTLTGGPDFRPMRTILAVESEWGHIFDAMGDFEKLLTTRACVKLFICRTSCKAIWLDYFKDYIENYLEKDRNELYLFALFDNGKFEYYESLAYEDNWIFRPVELRP